MRRLWWSRLRTARPVRNRHPNQKKKKRSKESDSDSSDDDAENEAIIAEIDSKLLYSTVKHNEKIVNAFKYF